MKKFMFATLAIVAMCAFVAPANAEKMMFGVKGGLNMANLTGDDVEDSSMKIGAVGGVFMSYDLTEIFAIQPELLFSMKGAKFEDGDLEENLKFNYFEIPLLLKVNLPTDGKIKPMLYAGPALGILMSAKVEDEDVKDYAKSMDIGILAGAGVGYAMEKGMLSFEVRYEVGMTGITDYTDEELEAMELEDQPDMKNTGLSFMVGYGFAF